MSTWSQVRRLVLVLAGAAFLTGCHTYQTVDAPVPGSTVRVSVPVSSAFSDPNAASQTAAVEGLLLSAGDTLVLAVETRRMFGVHREITQYDTMRVASTHASTVEVREFSTGRSVALGTVIAAAATGAAAVAFGLGGGSAGEGPDGTDPVSSIVVSRSLLGALWGLVGR